MRQHETRLRIAIIDSGVNPRHPHVGNIEPGVTIGVDGEETGYLDVLGHGTAVTGVVHLAAPQAALVPVRIFQNNLATNIHTLIRALDWCATHDIQIVNLSLGTANMQHEPAIRDALDRLHTVGAVVVSAWECAGVPALPGKLNGVVAVGADFDLTGDRYRVEFGGPKPIFYASAYPRPIPGLPVQRNLQGSSFAVAHMTGWVAGLWQPQFTAQADSRPDWEQILIQRATLFNTD